MVDFAVRHGISPEAAFVSHTDDDHFAGLLALYGAGRLHRVYCSYQEAERVAAAMPGAEVVPLAAGDVVLLDDETRAVVLYPYESTEAESANEASLVLLVEYRGHKALFPGDIGGAAETAVLTGVGRWISTRRRTTAPSTRRTGCRLGRCIRRTAWSARAATAMGIRIPGR